MFRHLKLFAVVLFLLVPSFAQKPLVVAQLSDLHIGLKQNGKTHEPIDALANLQRAVTEVNRRQPDVVLISGDIGENPEAWEAARHALARLNAPVHYAPGNHDVNPRPLEPYRRVFGADWYKFRVQNVEFYMLDAQLLGNYAN